MSPSFGRVSDRAHVGGIVSDNKQERGKPSNDLVSGCFSGTAW